MNNNDRSTVYKWVVKIKTSPASPPCSIIAFDNHDEAIVAKAAIESYIGYRNDDGMGEVILEYETMCFLIETLDESALEGSDRKTWRPSEFHPSWGVHLQLNSPIRPYKDLASAVRVIVENLPDYPDTWFRVVSTPGDEHAIFAPPNSLVNTTS